MTSTRTTERPPVVVVLGHVDHGKSSLLDFIRKTNIVAGEVGGITQHTAAYEVVHTTKAGIEKRITFIDTPGHSAFQAQRERGASLADIAILVVSAEDGVKAQTKEALRAIIASNIPYIVAINKIDLPNANIEATLNSLAENEIYVEGRGGSISYAPISAKRGDGVSELLDLVVLMAELQELSGDASLPAEGIIVEAHRDPKRGVSATIIIKDGSLAKGAYLATSGAWTPVRAIIDATGAPVENASFSSPITVLGWSALPHAGASMHTYTSKKDAENAAAATEHTTPSHGRPNESDPSAQADDIAVIPLILKADVAGSLDALSHEVGKLSDDRVSFKIILSDVGAVSENDIKRAGGDDRTVIVGFNTKIENGVRELAERAGITIETDAIIYKLTEKLEELRAIRRPKRMVEEHHGTAKVLKLFATAHTKQVIGARVEEGTLNVGDAVNIVRRGEAIGKGKVLEVQQNKQKTQSVSDGVEFGTKIDSAIEIAVGDQIVAFSNIAR